MGAIGRQDLADDPDLAHNDGRAARADELDAVIGEWTGARDREAVIRVLGKAGVPVGKIYSVADIAADPQYRSRDMILDIEDRDGNALKVPGIVPKLSATPGGIRRRAPALGEHNTEILGAEGWPGDDS